MAPQDAEVSVVLTLSVSGVTDHTVLGVLWEGVLTVTCGQYKLLLEKDNAKMNVS